MKNIRCKSNRACLIEGTTTELDLKNSQVNEVVSNKPLMVFTQSEKIKMSNIQLIQMSFYPNNLINAIEVSQVKTIIIEGSLFQNFNAPCFMVKNSDIQIQRTLFTNEYHDSTAAMTFLVLEVANSVLNENTFIGHTKNNGINGGVEVS